jgi:hypothetical protein
MKKNVRELFCEAKANIAGNTAYAGIKCLFKGFDFKRAALPFLILLMAIAVCVMPENELPQKRTDITTLRVADFPVILVTEQQGGVVSSAWLRTPAGVREIEQANGLSFVSDGAFISKVDQDEKDDLLWRVSFTNLEGNGVHLWIGMTTGPPKVFISVSPYQYTRWDAVPAKLIVPKGTAIYVAPSTPTYNKAGQFNGKESYSFVYTVRMTPEGPAFVPVPSVYKQLAVLLRAGIQGEFDPMKRLAYVRMLNEFNSLAEGKPPRAETLLNFQMLRSATLSWKR